MPASLDLMFAEGLTEPFASDLQERIESLLLPAAARYFEPEGTAYSQNDPSLKRLEMAVNYFDYQPCAVSTLALIASRGDRSAEMLVRTIFENAAYYLDEWRGREGYTTSLRRSQLHLVLAYETLRDDVESSLAERWRALLLRSAADMLDHFNHLKEKTPALDNRSFGTGINHVAIAAEGIWRTGFALDQPDLCELSGSLIDRLVAYGHPDGYFEEHTNDEREGGPSLVYTSLTAGCAYVVQNWRECADLDRFAKCGALFRSFCDHSLAVLPISDERANPKVLGPYGVALHALSPEGRGYLRAALDPERNPLLSSNGRLEYLSRLHFELGMCKLGSGSIPEPFIDGAFRISLPIGVQRSHGWTAAVSGLRALNRDIATNSDYALDRQSLVSLSHKTAGTILSGAKSKKDPSWSTLRSDEDAYPVRTGTLDEDFTATAHYQSFTGTVKWELADEAKLTLRSSNTTVTAAQLTLEASRGATLYCDGQKVQLGDDPIVVDDVRSVKTEHWTVKTSIPGKLDWYIAPYNPYSEGNVSAPSSRRPVLRLPFEEEMTFTFRATGQP